MKKKFNVTGMTCAACQTHVGKSVNNLEGVKIANVNLLSNSMVVEFDENKLTDKDIIHAVEESGYGATIYENEQLKVVQLRKKKELNKQRNFLIASFSFLIPLIYIAMGHMLKWPLPDFVHKDPIVFIAIQMALTIPIVILNFHYFTSGFKRLFTFAPNMDSLIAIGSVAALFYGVYAFINIILGVQAGNDALVEHHVMNVYFEAAGTILTLVSLGKYLENTAKGKTTAAIEKLINLTPEVALVLIDDKEVEVPVEDIQVGDIVIIKPGMTIPVDGIIVDGYADIDQAAITGESVPVFKQVGDKVISATLNRVGSFKFKVEKVGKDTTLSQIITLVEEAANSKAPMAKLADKVAGIFVPIVIAIALVTFVIWSVFDNVEMAMNMAVAVLVISCPCALGLATPVAIMVGTGKGAESGILVKSAVAFERFNQVDTIVFDKTGTLTKGEMAVTNIVADNEEQLLVAVASIEKKSEHSLAEAIVRYAIQKGLKLSDHTTFTYYPGLGLIGDYEEVTYFVGNLKLMKDHQLDVLDYEAQAERLAIEGKTVLYVGQSGKVIGLIALADEIKLNSAKAVQELISMGKDVILLTGDQKITAKAVAESIGISHYIAEVLPEGKEKEIAALQSQGKVVAMVGDGINDAPALTRADVGISLGAGTDIAIESADIILMKNDLLDVVTALQLTKKVVVNIKMNLFWAFIYNIIGIPLAAGVLYPAFGLLLTPMFASLAMSISSVTVVLNALRLRYFKTKWKKG